MNNLENCSVCAIRHVDPEYALAYMQTTGDRAQLAEAIKDVRAGCRLARDCGEALAGKGFEDFIFNEANKVVSYRFQGKEVALLTVEDCDGNHEVDPDKIHEFIVAKFKEVTLKK